MKFLTLLMILMVVGCNNQDLYPSTKRNLTHIRDVSIRALAREYINKHKKETWIIKELGKPREKEGYFYIFVELYNPKKYIPYKRWEYATCGMLWFSKEGEMVNDDIVDSHFLKSWKK